MDDQGTVTAALLGAGYMSSIPIVLIALRAREWQQVRTLVVMGLAITGFTTLATFRHLDLFHFDSGPFSARLSAWTWLVVYVAIPPMLLAAFVIGERAGGRSEYAVQAPLRPWMRWALFAFATPLTVLGLGLAFLPATFADVWPWPLTPLTAGAVAAWLLTLAVGCWWSLREADWRRVRVAFPAFFTAPALALVGAARYSEALDGGVRTWIYLAVLVGLLGSRRLHGSSTSAMRRPSRARGNCSLVLTPEERGHPELRRGSNTTRCRARC